MDQRPCQAGIEAKVSAKAAHTRLDSINGQIAGLRTAVEASVATAHARDEKRDQQHSDLRVEVANVRTEIEGVKGEVGKVKTRAGTMAGIGALVATVIGTAIANAYFNHPAPAQPSPRASASAIGR